jgi:hypothetical protein
MAACRWFAVGFADGSEREAGAAAEALVHHDVKRTGFYRYGEIARTRGMRGFNNQTLVVLSIG